MLVSHLQFKPVLNTLKYISLWGILLSSLSSCQPSLISIEKISASKVDKTVYLTGKIVRLAPFLDSSAYQVEDATGKIWVVTDQKPPMLGQVIKVRGKIKYQSLPFAEQELGDFYLIELEQLEATIVESNYN
ncbi:MAG: hypothetical protein AAGE96_13450 [Cyanobacteria bacterium P01_G01_bin.19]